jgi:hypothetical protein
MGNQAVAGTKHAPMRFAHCEDGIRWNDHGETILRFSGFYCTSGLGQQSDLESVAIVNAKNFETSVG